MNSFFTNLFKLYRIRQLINGKWVAEVRGPFWLWYGIDPGGYKYYPGAGYQRCFCDSEQEAKDRIACYGVIKL